MIAKLFRPLAATALCLSLGTALSGCGHSDSAADAASSDNVEMPAEEALRGIAATPVPDSGASATASDSAASAASPSSATPAPASAKP